MKFLTVLLFFTASFSPTAHAFSLLVGNAGEGILEDGHVYLRDLYESDLHLDPFVGRTIDAEITSQLKDLKLLDVDLSLLGKKLSDLNRIHPHLGTYVLMVITHYHWILIETPLQAFPSEGSPIFLKVRLPLANRYRSTIRIQKQTWKMMPEIHKVALIIHESLSALQDPRCRRRFCFQDTAEIREIVARIFTMEGVIYPAWMPDHFNIPDTLPTDCGKQTPRMVYDDNSRFPPHGNKKNEYIRDTCQESLTSDAIIQVVRKPLAVREFTYRTRRPKNIYFQTAVRITRVPPRLIITVKHNPDPLKRRKCVSAVNSVVNNWLKYGTKTLSDSRFPTCTRHIQL